MRKALLAALVPLAFMVFSATASAHFITSSYVGCQGTGASWASFPAGPTQFTLKWIYGSQQVKVQSVNATTKSDGTGSYGPIPLPFVPPNGTDVQVFGTWTADGGGSFDVSQTLSCQPVVSNATIDCAGFHFTWTSVLSSPVITVSWKSPAGWASTTVQESGHGGATTVPLPQTPPNGTVITGLASWNGGSTQLVSSQPTTCVPVPPPPPPSPPPAPPTPPSITPPPPPPPTPPAPPHHHRHHHHPHVVTVALSVSFFNQDPQPIAMASSANRFGCRIVGPPASLQHGLAHWVVRCRSAKVLPGWRWSIDGRRVRNEHWTYTTDGGRRLNSWLFDRAAWTNPMVWGHYTITARGPVRT